MSSEKILIVTHDFPPALSGVRRVVKFAKYLPEFGFDPIVLASKPDTRMPPDYEAAAEVIRQGYPVWRTASFDPFYLVSKWRAIVTAFGSLLPNRLRSKPKRKKSFAPRHRTRKATRVKKRPARPVTQSKFPESKSFLRAISRWLFIPDERVGWLPFALPLARRIVRRERPTVLLTSSYPNSAHLIGLKLRRKSKLTWVADFRDGWMQNPYFANWPTWYHALRNRRLERKVARRADALITVSQPIADHLRKICGRPAKVFIIPNGFDGSDYAGLEPHKFTKFTIAYTGTLFMQRSPETFLRALRMLFDQAPGLENEMQAIFMSRFQPEHQRLVRELRLGEVVQVWKLDTHRQALRLQISADALLAIEGAGKGSEIMLTQKVFEYFAARKPIVALAPPGALSDVVRRTRAGIVVAPEDLQGIRNRLWELYHGRFNYAPDETLLAHFERRELTRDLASIISNARKKM